MEDLGSVDIIVLVIFLFFNVITIAVRERIRNFKEFASGRGDEYGGLPIVCTITALFCSASLFWAGVEQVYLQGSFIIWYDFITEMLACLFAWYFYIPKLVSMDCYTLHEYMSWFYGNNIRRLFAISETCQRIGRFAVQLCIIGKTFQIVWGLSLFHGNLVIIVFSVLMAIYSSFGGLRAVTYTDVIQFFFFFVIIPTISLWIWHIADVETGGHEYFKEVWNMPRMSFSGIFSTPESFIAAMAVLARTVLVTPLNIPYFQRIQMCKTVGRARKLWFFSTVCYGIIIVFILFIGLQLLGVTKGIDPATGEEMKINGILPYMLDHYSFPGMKMMFFVCIVSLAVSTSDSEFNGLATLYANDIAFFKNGQPLRTCKSANMFAWMAGSISLLLALRFNDIFKLLMFVQNFFLPVAVVPTVATIFGLRTHKNCVWIGVVCGVLATIIHSILARGTGYSQYSFGPGMLANAMGLFVSHTVWVANGGIWWKSSLKKSGEL